MPFISNSDSDVQEMLSAIGVKDFGELIKNIPTDLVLERPLDLPPAMSEGEVFSHLNNLAGKNKSGVSFVGGGAYDHYTPAIIGTLISRSEFQTAYTPYQPEVSQGTLQSIYEFQTHIARLTAMDVANASMYDGASAMAEAIVVAINATRKNTIIIPDGLNPAYLEVAKTYLYNYDIKWVVLENRDGIADPGDLENKLDENVAAVVLQQPNYFGLIEPGSKIGGILKERKTLFIVVADPNSLGILEAPGNYHADIVVGEGQSLGIPLNFGGPYVGFFATTMALVRKIPGRIVGVSEDKKGRRGYLLTLQAREQHIRRDKATSNICTNSGLMALAATIYISWLGKEGLTKLSDLILQKSHYLSAQIESLDGYDLLYNNPFYKEMTVSCPVPPEKIIQMGIARGIKAGIDISAKTDSPSLLVAVTERRNRDDLDAFVQLQRNAGSRK